MTPPGYPALFLTDDKRLASLPASPGPPLLVGRSRSAWLFLSDPGIAREQFQIVLEDNRYVLERISEEVTTFVNGTRVETWVWLSHGDVITLGKTSLVFLEREEPSITRTLAAARRETPITEPSRGIAQTVMGTHPVEEALPAVTPEILLNRDLEIGRDPAQVDVVLEHPRVSRRHAAVKLSDGAIYLRDLKSSNGTYINGERISGFRQLRTGDRIDIGPYSLKFTGRSLVQSSREGNLRVEARNLIRAVPSHNGDGMVRVLDDVTLVIEPREFVCILGSSGSGKSTLMHALSARNPADAGQVLLNDANLYASFQALKQGIAFVPQKEALHEDLTLEEALDFTSRLRLPPDTSEEGIRKAVEMAIRRIDLAHSAKKPIRHLSGGQKKRASLANETASRPNLLFVDEVTSGLDEGTDWEMMRLFRRMADDGLTIVCVTHTVANVEDFCHKIVVMTSPGVLAFYGTPAEAKEYFGVQKLGDIYRQLATRQGKEWQADYRRSDFYRRHVENRLAYPVETPKETPSSYSKEPLKKEFEEIRRQFGLLARRYGRLVLADKKTLAIAAGQSVLVGVLLALVYGDLKPSDPAQFMLAFFLGISCLWYGCNNAAKEIVKERPIYRLERDVNLSVVGYVLSKMAILGLIGIAQAVLLFVVLNMLGRVPGDATQQLFIMSVTVLTGTALGLLISAAAKTTDQATTLVPIALIPQILLSGAMSQLPDPVASISQLAVSGYSVFHGMTSVIAQKQGEIFWAVLRLVSHIIVGLTLACVILFVRDSRGEMVYGKGIERWIKNATRR